MSITHGMNVEEVKGLERELRTHAQAIEDIKGKLNAKIDKVLMQPDVQQSIRSQGGDVNPTTPEELGLRLKADILKWRGVIDAAKITLE